MKKIFFVSFLFCAGCVVLDSAKGQRVLANESGARMGCDPMTTEISNHRFGEETGWIRTWNITCSDGRKFNCARVFNGNMMYMSNAKWDIVCNSAQKENKT